MGRMPSWLWIVPRLAWHAYLRLLWFYVVVLGALGIAALFMALLELTRWALR